MYKSKLLFKNTNGTFSRDASAIESVWAYLYGVDTKTTGRFRIRITKMSAQELIAMGLAPEETPSDMYGLQANLDRWHEDHAWLPLFDWVGDPMTDIEDIERELGKQFQAFVTGIAIDEVVGFDLPPKPPKKPKTKRPFKMPDSKKYYDKTDIKDISEDKINDLPNDDSDDFEWI